MIDLRLGDCLDTLPTIASQSVDVVIIDPPYCSGGHLEAQKNTKAQGLRSATVQAGDFEWFPNDNMSTAGLVWLLRSAMLEFRRILKPNRSVFVFTDWRMVTSLAPALESTGLRYRNMIVWNKGNGGLSIGFKPTHEIILEFTNGTTEYAVKDGSNVLNFPRVHSSKKEHNAQKPVDLIKEIIRVATRENATVLDCFMGSGTAGVAAVQLERNFIGIEKESNYFAIAQRRIETAQMETV